MILTQQSAYFRLNFNFGIVYGGDRSSGDEGYQSMIKNDFIFKERSSFSNSFKTELRLSFCLSSFLSSTLLASSKLFCCCSVKCIESL